MLGVVACEAYNGTLDLWGWLCYNITTSERFFFFAENPKCSVFINIVRCFSFCNYMLWNGTYFTELREAFTFTRVKAKNISVKREVPL